MLGQWQHFEFGRCRLHLPILGQIQPTQDGALGLERLRLRKGKRNSASLNTDGSCLGALCDYSRHKYHGRKDRPDPQDSNVHRMLCFPTSPGCCNASCLSTA